MWKNHQSQFNFNSTGVKQHKALTEFDEINALIDWSELSTLLNPLYSNKTNKQGAMPYNPLMMFKILLFQTWHNLSDPQTENMLARDLLFRQFVGLHLTDSVPDYSSIWRFRDKLNKANLMEPLFDNLNNQLARQSIIIKTGAISIIDATVIKAHHNRPNKNSKGENTQDPDASYNVKRGSDGKLKTTFGFKGHIKCDEDGFITQTAFTTGSVHDSQVLESLLDESDSELYADSAYASKTITQMLQDRGINNHILKRAYRNTPLTEAEKSYNKSKSGIRSRVERVFGIGKIHLGLGQARYIGQLRNQLSFMLRCMVLNLKRARTIKREMDALWA